MTSAIRDSPTPAPEDRCVAAAGLRRGLLLLAVVLTVIAGPLGRPAAEQHPSGEVFRPVSVSSSEVPAQAR